MRYLQWIFFHASKEQLAELPTQTRLDAAKKSLREIIESNPEVEFSLDTLNRGMRTNSRPAAFWENVLLNGARSLANGIIVPFGSSREKLLEGLDKIVAFGPTPLVKRYVDSLNYFKKGHGNLPSPVNSECQTYNIILVTDGVPSRETPVKLFDKWIGDYDLDGVEEKSNDGCTLWTCAGYGDDAAYFALNTADFNESIAGRQFVRTHTVGFGISFALLDKMAERGGTGESLLATSSEDLTSILEDLLDTIVVTAASGGGTSAEETTGEEGMIFRSRFQADYWTGHLDAFEVKAGTSELIRRYDVAQKLEQRTKPRSIYAGVDTDDDGVAEEFHVFDYEANASIFAPHLFKSFQSQALDPNSLMEPLQDFEVIESARTLMEFIHGKQIPGLRIRDSEGDGGNADMGDIVYSSVVTNSVRNSNYQRLNGYEEFMRQQDGRKKIVIFGSNDGFLHGVDSSDGEELWSYIPSELLPHLELLSRYNYNVELRRAFVDGPISVQDVFLEGRWRTIAIAGLRSGGSSYVVLDITEPTQPTLLFEVNRPDLYGQSWFEAAVVPTHDGKGNELNPGSYLWHLVLGTGEGKSNKGTSLVIYDLNKSSEQKPVIVSLGSAEPIGTRLSPPALVQGDSDMSIDRLYVGSESGDMYRVETRGKASTWKAIRLFDGVDSQPITGKPVVVLVENTAKTSLKGKEREDYRLAAGVYWGTGRFDSLTDQYLVRSPHFQRIFGVFDPINYLKDNYKNALKNVTLKDLERQEVDRVTAELDPEHKKYLLQSGKRGFFLDLSTSIELDSQFLVPAGMVIGNPKNVKGLLLFPTFLPSTGESKISCQLGGHAFLNGINFRTGGGVLLDSSSSKSPFYNGGVYDLTGDGAADEYDLLKGVSLRIFSAPLDTNISGSLNLDEMYPYKHDGKLSKEDVWLNGGVVNPSVASLGNTGIPGNVSLLETTGLVVVQPTFIEVPSLGRIQPPQQGGGNREADEGAKDAEDEESVGTENEIGSPPPVTVPYQTYRRAADVLGFHEVVE